MTAAPPRRIRCSSPQAHRKASYLGCSGECVEIVLYMSSLSATASCGDDGFFLVVVVLALGCRLQAGKFGGLRQPETMGSEAQGACS